MMEIQNSTIEQLENDYWPPLKEGEFSSYLMRTCHELRSKKIGDFEIEDLRIMIGNGIGMNYLVPIAIKELSTNILAEGDYYDGDLLNSVLSSDLDYWKSNQAQRKEVIELFEANITILKQFDTADKIKNGWFDCFESFKQISG